LTERLKVSPEEVPAYPDNRNLFDMVLEALWLFAGIFLGHDPEQSKITEIQNPNRIDAKSKDICLSQREANWSYS